MAAVLAAKMLSEAEISCPIKSAGVHASPDCAASAHAITVMGEEGCDLLSHRSQKVTETLLAEATLILAMTRGHRAALCSTYPHAVEKIFTLNEYAEQGFDIDDPFGGDYTVYRNCASQIKELLQIVVQKYKRDF